MAHTQIGCTTLEKLDRQTDDLLDDINDPSQPSSSPAKKSRSWTRGDPPHKRPPLGREKASVECWNSFSTAKKSMHARYDIEKVKGHAWHHVVGQFNSSRSKLSKHDLHCTDNLIYLPKSVHDPISSHYRRAPDPPRSGLSHVYDWQATFSFEEQWNYGIARLKEHGMSIPERMQQ